MIKNYKIILQYEGTRYNGWQRQGNTKNTIQEKVENVVSLLAGKPTEVFASGRTDAGTHALNQVANFHIDTKLSAIEIMDYINRYLPEDIAVTYIEEADLRFHSRLNAKRKTYCYRLQKGKIKNVFERKYIAQYPEPLDVDLMKRASLDLIGKHNFKSFCANNKMKKSTERTIYDISIEEIDNEIRFTFCGSGFLHHMVRIMVGTLCEIGCGLRSADSIPEIIKGEKRELAGETMPSKGLILMNVEY